MNSNSCRIVNQFYYVILRNERVVGSNPISGSNKIKASEKLEAFFLCLWRYLAAHKNKTGLGTVARVFVRQVLISLMGIGDVWYGDRAFFPFRRRRTRGRIYSRCCGNGQPKYSPDAHENSSCHRLHMSHFHRKVWQCRH